MGLDTLDALERSGLGKDIDSDEFRSVNSAKAETFRVVAGLEGSVFSDWEWDAYYQYGRNTRDQTVSNTRVNSFFQYALDAVRAPSVPVALHPPRARIGSARG